MHRKRITVQQRANCTTFGTFAAPLALGALRCKGATWVKYLQVYAIIFYWNLLNMTLL